MDDLRVYIGIAFFLSVVFAAGCMVGALGSKPSALEVYQGKTTLEITYKDSIPIDSVVVYKER